MRSYNALKRAGINTIDELRKLSINELRNIRNLGQKCFEENEDSKYEEELIKEYEKHYGEVKLDKEDDYEGEDSEEDDYYDDEDEIETK